MVTLERIVESIKIQLKPNITDDVIIHDDWLIDIIDQSRAAILRKKYLSGDSFSSYYQEIIKESTPLYKTEKEDENWIPYKYPIEVINISKIIGTIGKRNIQYLGSLDHTLTDINYVEYEQFIAYDKHRFGGSQPCYTLLSDRILIRNTYGQKKWLIRAVFSSPYTIEGYDYENSEYPIDEADLRTLEIITFQHIAQKLGMPVDVFNNGRDETINVPVEQQSTKQKSQEQQEEE